MADQQENINNPIIVKGKIANAITSAAKNHIVATTDDIYDTNFSEYQDEINRRLSNDINTLQDEVGEINSNVIDINNKIPNEASSDNQLADKEYVNTLVSKTSSFFRGSWSNWSSVPTDSEEYPEDINGNRTPRLGDYLVINDASDYVVESGLTGTWRFTYNGEWDVEGKSGWKKEYQINEESQVTISFYWKYYGDDDSNAVLITQNKVTKSDTLNSYPELTETEFKDGGYWDTPITELRNITEDKMITYIIPIEIDAQLIELCYENGWCSSPSFISANEMQNLTNE